jgi:hypothetical protein
MSTRVPVITEKSSYYGASFNASATRYCKITATSKSDFFLNDTTNSCSLELHSYQKQYTLSDIVPASVFSLYLGYRKDVSISISDFTYDFTDSIKEEKLGTAYNIYPNPVSNILYLDYEGEFRLFSLAGKLVRKGFCTGTVDVADLENGFYTLHTKSGIYKLIKN